MKRITWLQPGDPPTAFPPVSRALDEPPGLLAAGGDLTPERLMAAYVRGIFPWYSPGEPVMWWSPDPREVLFPAEIHVSRSLARVLLREVFTVTENRDFEGVITGCAEARSSKGGTWITPQMRTAYLRLHALGVASSIEVWAGEELAGGLYGVRSGRVFSGESMFTRRDNASKIALVWLARQCASRGIALIDCQMPSAHLRSMGSRAISRSEFLRYLPPGPEQAQGTSPGFI